MSLIDDITDSRWRQDAWRRLQAESRARRVPRWKIEECEEYGLTITETAPDGYIVCRFPPGTNARPYAEFILEAMESA